MLIAFGIWEPFYPQSGGTRKSYIHGLACLDLSTDSSSTFSFLITDAQDDMAGERLKS